MVIQDDIFVKFRRTIPFVSIKFYIISNCKNKNLIWMYVISNYHFYLNVKPIRMCSKICRTYSFAIPRHTFVCPLDSDENSWDSQPLTSSLTWKLSFRISIVGKSGTKIRFNKDPNGDIEANPKYLHLRISNCLIAIDS